MLGLPGAPAAGQSSGSSVLRRSRLYYLRELSGKKARLRSKIRDLSGLVAEADKPGSVESLARAAEEATEAQAAEAAAS